MDTYFASPERTTDRELAFEIDLVSKNPVLSGLLHSISGLLAILDDHRQIIAVNDSFLRMLGVDDPAHTLGLRPGEVLNCVHAHRPPAGCGTTHACSTCGAAIAIVASLEQDQPAEKICALSATKNDQQVDMSLLIKSHPIKIDGRRFLLLFIQDITQQQQRAALERTFFHDINNMLSVLVGASELLALESSSKLAKTVHKTTLHLVKEVAIQRCLSQSQDSSYEPLWQVLTTAQIVDKLRSLFATHPIARKCDIIFPDPIIALQLKTDLFLVMRVLGNMIINALEATPENGKAKLWIADEGDFVSFHVWNKAYIPQPVATRIFQRNFSTKKQDGRGIGTYSMKLFGEKVLGGRVRFTTDEADGTTFSLTLQKPELSRDNTLEMKR